MDKKRVSFWNVLKLLSAAIVWVCGMAVVFYFTSVLWSITFLPTFQGDRIQRIDLMTWISVSGVALIGSGIVATIVGGIAHVLIRRRLFTIIIIATILIVGLLYALLSIGRVSI